jgi:hypothetical protein
MVTAGIKNRGWGFHFIGVIGIGDEVEDINR